MLRRTGSLIAEARSTMRKPILGPIRIARSERARRCDMSAARGRALLAVVLAAATSMLATTHASLAAQDPRNPRIPARAMVGDASIPDAKFEFACGTGNGGMFSISLILPESVPGFPLGEFEGPDGIGETRDLAEWSVSGTPKPARARTSISGWYGVDGDGFLLSRARESAHLSDIARIAKQLVASDQARLRLVVKPLTRGKALKVEAPIAGYREAVAKAIEPCLAPSK
jgi:hypothetical protein